VLASPGGQDAFMSRDISRLKDKIGCLIGGCKDVGQKKVQHKPLG
jgi:hypothetical protein